MGKAPIDLPLNLKTYNTIILQTIGENMKKFKVSDLSILVVEKFEKGDRKELRAKMEKMAEDISLEITVPLNPNQLGAISSFALSIGWSAFKISKVFKLLSYGEFEEALHEMVSCVERNGVVDPKVVERRGLEKRLFLTK